MSSYTSISADKLSRLVGTAHTPTLIDVRIDQDFDAMLLYDAFYRWCRDATGETHNWPTNKGKTP